MSSERLGPAGTSPIDQTPALSPQGAGGGQRPGDFRGLESKRLAVALLLSLGIHALLLSLTFGGQGLGLAGLSLPWQDRRGEAPGLRVWIVPARVTAAQPPERSAAAPLPNTAIEPPAAGKPALTASVFPAPQLRRTVEAVAPDTKPTSEVPPQGEHDAVVAADAKVPPSTDPADVAPAPIPEPAMIASERADEPTWVVRPAPSVPTPVIAAARSASSPEPELQATRDAGDEEREPIGAEDRDRAADPASSDRAELEAQRRAQELQAALLQAQRVEAERQEAVRQQAARQEAARFEAAWLEAERQQAARLAAALQEEARQEAARQEAARQEVARQEALRAAAASLEAERMEAARQALARQETAHVQAAQAQEARREEARRAMGRQLDEENARRDAAPRAPGTQNTLPYSWSSARRGRLFGHTHASNELIEYAQAWARKLQLNMTFDMVREVAKRPHINPLVTVAIRHDGSVESVTFVVSSGVAEIDDAIRHIVHGQAPYQAFPPGLASEFDVIEVRRTWSFDMAVRLY